MRILIFIAVLLISSAATGNEIVWQAAHRFRLIDYEASKSTFEITNGKTAFDFVAAQMAARNRDMLPPIDHTYWNSDASVARRLSDDYIFPKAHKVVAWIDGSATGRCIWEYQGYSKDLNCQEQFEFQAKTQYGSGSEMLTVKSVSGEFELTTDVEVKDRLILGLGDSYASGEGNPDIPTKISDAGITSLAQANPIVFTTGRWTNNRANWVERDARWFDKQCHRSMFSQHVLAAMRIASENPKETVTLVPLACSGAEILDGLLIPQKYPPGGGKSVYDSQINIAMMHLCRNGSLRKVKKAYYRGYTGDEQRHLEYAYVYRCDGELRKPDAILLSVGGNDVGFAPTIAWATMPNGHRNILGFFAVNITHLAIKPVCPKYTGQSVCNSNKPVGKDRIKYWLPDYYKWLSDELAETGLIANEKNVFMTAYPNPIFIEDGKTLCGKDRNTDMNEQARTRLPRQFITHRWDLGITQSEMGDVNVGLINPLFETMRATSVKYGWTFVDSHMEGMVKHGICAGYKRESPTIPIYPHIRDGVWYPERPDHTWAYDVDRPRWFRNTNDSVLFQTDDTDSNMNGAFHPDFRSHAFIADYLFEAISKRWSPADTFTPSK